MCAYIYVCGVLLLIPQVNHGVYLESRLVYLSYYTLLTITTNEEEEEEKGFLFFVLFAFCFDLLW